jgi:hypothetical protein|tara:strand:+ start:653 stop:814 length:162 start_codon:yes stop_codon:yes gene_type:complete
MKKEDVMLLAQLLHTMKELAEKMERYYENKDIVRLDAAKKEMLELQKRVSELI